jgi:hypothetical protein
MVSKKSKDEAKTEEEQGFFQLKVIFLLSFTFVGVACGLGVLKYLGLWSVEEEE